MFEQLLHFSRWSDNMGVIYSVQGGHYLAMETNHKGELLRQAEQPFQSLSQAKTWLQKHGVESISLRQTPAYFEMIGLPQ